MTNTIHKHSFVAALMLLVFASASAQTCEPDTTNFSLFSPASEDLPCIERGVPYHAVVHFFCPPALATYTIDSIKVTGVTGFPQGISYDCFPQTCTMIGYGRACISISGITNDSTGFYLLEYSGYVDTDQGRASFSYLSSIGGIPEYSLKVINPGDVCRGLPNSINENEHSSTAIHLYPNPNNGQFQLDIRGANKAGGTLMVTDATGRNVLTKKIDNESETIAVDLSGVSKGLYLVKYRNSSGVVTKTVSVE